MYKAGSRPRTRISRGGSREVIPLMVRATLRSIGTAAGETIREFVQNHPFELAAACSFYTLLSLAPLLLLVVYVAGIVWGQSAAAGHLSQQMDELIGPEAAKIIGSVIAHAGQSRRGHVVAGAGLLTLLFGATGAVVQLRKAINRIWKAPADPPGGFLWRFLRTRLLSMGVVLAAGFLLQISLLSRASLAALQARARGTIPVHATFWGAANRAATFAVIAALMAVIYRFLPDVRIAWSGVVVGALVTALLIEVGRSLVGLYLGRAGIGSAYGAAGSLVVLLVWVYYSCLTLFLGAQVTHVFARRTGRIVGAARSGAGAAKASSTHGEVERGRALHRAIRGR